MPHAIEAKPLDCLTDAGRPAVFPSMRGELQASISSDPKCRRKIAYPKLSLIPSQTKELFSRRQRLWVQSYRNTLFFVDQPNHCLASYDLHLPRIRPRAPDLYQWRVCSTLGVHLRIHFSVI